MEMTFPRPQSGACSTDTGSSPTGWVSRVTSQSRGATSNLARACVRCNAPVHPSVRAVSMGVSTEVGFEAPQVRDAPEGQRVSLLEVGEQSPEMFGIGGVEPYSAPAPLPGTRPRGRPTTQASPRSSSNPWSACPTPPASAKTSQLRAPGREMRGQGLARGLLRLPPHLVEPVVEVFLLVLAPGIAFETLEAKSLCFQENLPALVEQEHVALEIIGVRRRVRLQEGVGPEPGIREVVEVEPGQAYGEVGVAPSTLPFGRAAASTWKHASSRAGWILWPFLCAATASVSRSRPRASPSRRQSRSTPLKLGPYSSPRSNSPSYRSAPATVSWHRAISSSGDS